MDSSAKERFWCKVDMSGDCWNWKAGKLSCGYGVFHVDGRSKKAHRVAYELVKGEIPAGLFVCHSCDNRACVNPDHLWIGTHTDNVRDMHAKGRNNTPRGSGHWRSKLTPDEVLQIRAEVAAGADRRDVSKKFNIAHQYVSKIVLKQKWKHLEANNNE